jgi:hypothetical protein
LSIRRSVNAKLLDGYKGEGVVFIDVDLMLMALSQGQVQQQVSVSVMKLAMGDTEQQGEALQKLRGTAAATANHHAAQPHLGGSIDLKL